MADPGCSKNKMTDKKRYATSYPNLELSLETKVESWEAVFKSRHNKSILKELISQFLTEQSNNLLGGGQTLYLTGGNDQLPAGSVVKISKKSSGQTEITEVAWSLTAGESDHKIFQFVRFWREDKP